MTNNSILSTLILSIFLSAFMLPYSSYSWAQTYCISGISDLDLECGNLDWEFIYTDLDGAFVHTCGDETDVLAIQLSIDVSIDSVNCSDPLDPKLKIIITRVITADVIDPLATDCVNGAGFVCATQIINYRDFTLPTFANFPPDSTVTCENWDLLDYLISGVFAVDPIDDCGNAAQILTLDTVMGSCSAEQEFHWEFVLTDGCDNNFSKIHSVFIVDTVGPQITFLPSVFEPFECVEDIIWPEIDSFDMCSEVEQFWWGDTSQTALDCPNNVHYSRTAYAVDFCGNVDSATYEIQVNDQAPPELVYIPLGFSIQCDEEPEFENAIAVDGCAGQVTITEQIDTLFSPNCEQNYTLTRVFTATDVCGNSSPGAQIIVVSDMTPPILLPPPDFGVNCDETIDLDDAISWDNCDPNPTVEWTTEIINITSAGTYDIIREFTSTDACNNSYTATQTINVVDNTPPFFTSFPSDLVLLCGDDYPDDQASYEDSCDPDAYLSDYDPLFDFQPCASNTVISRTFTISDDAGNEFSQTQYITFLDEDPPILLTPLDSLFYQCAYEVPDCMEIFDGLEFDDCSSGDVIPIECSDVVVEGNCEEQACIIERTYYFVDACGNQGSAKQYITVQESVLAPEMPTGMTPNGDGYNDAYVIKGIGPSVNTEPGEVQCDWLEDTRIRIINRWGSIVFEELDYRNDWEGIADSGEDLPPGTYFVVFEALGESFSTYVDIRR